MFYKHALGISKQQVEINQHAQQSNVDILKNIFSSLLNQRYVTFQPLFMHMDVRTYANEM